MLSKHHNTQCLAQSDHCENLTATAHAGAGRRERGDGGRGDGRGDGRGRGEGRLRGEGRARGAGEGDGDGDGDGDGGGTNDAGEGGGGLAGQARVQFLQWPGRVLLATSGGKSCGHCLSVFGSRQMISDLLQLRASVMSMHECQQNTCVGGEHKAEGWKHGRVCTCICGQEE